MKLAQGQVRISRGFSLQLFRVYNGTLCNSEHDANPQIIVSPLTRPPLLKCIDAPIVIVVVCGR